MQETKAYCDRCYRDHRGKVEAHFICIKCGQDICHYCVKHLMVDVSVCEYCYDEDDIREIRKDMTEIFKKIDLIKKTTGLQLELKKLGD